MKHQMEFLQDDYGDTAPFEVVTDPNGCPPVHGFWGALATIGSGIIGGIGSLLGAKTQADAAGDASGLQYQASQNALQSQEKMYYQGREDLAPWREAGGQAIGNLNALMQQGPGQFQESPGYQFTLNEGLKATERGAAGRTGLLSGPTQKAMTRYATGLASNEYDNFLKRYYDKLKPYQSMAGVGQTSASQTAQLGGQSGLGMAQSALYGGDALAQGQLAGGNAWAKGLQGLANTGQNTIQNYMNYLAIQNQKPTQQQPMFNYQPQPGGDYPTPWGIS